MAPIKGGTIMAIEARPSYVLVLVEDMGVSEPFQRAADRLGGVKAAYSNQYPARPTNDAVEFKTNRRFVGTLGSAAPDEDLEEARELLREEGASPPDDVATENTDAATAEAEGR